MSICPDLGRADAQLHVTAATDRLEGRPAHHAADDGEKVGLVVTERARRGPPNGHRRAGRWSWNSWPELGLGKSCDHLPLHRQAEIYARDGIDLDRSTLADWVGQCAWLLRPLVDAIGAHVMAAARVHADAAAIYTLTETAKLNRFDPEDYLRKVLERIADYPVRRFHEFLPWNLDGIRQRLDQRDAA